MLSRLLRETKNSYKRLQTTIHSPEHFLNKYSGKIVGVGDIFDLKRSAIVGESERDYLKRTEKWWKHIVSFVVGNHDAALLRRNFSDSQEFYKNKNVLALHGHQLKFTFNQAKIMEYEKYWDVQFSEDSIMHDIEEFVFSVFNKFFSLHGKRAYAQALSTLEGIDKRNMLSEDVDIVITGHTHLSFDEKIIYKNKKYRVINCGSSLHGKKFNPVYVEEIDLWFVSDLHLGTIKSVFDY